MNASQAGLGFGYDSARCYLSYCKQMFSCSTALSMALYGIRAMPAVIMRGMLQFLVRRVQRSDRLANTMMRRGLRRRSGQRKRECQNECDDCNRGKQITSHQVFLPIGSLDALELASHAMSTIGATRQASPAIQRLYLN